jgi:hypothetical protein
MKRLLSFPQALSFFFAAYTLAACAPSQQETKDKGEVKSAAQEATMDAATPKQGEVMKKFDLNKDGKADLYKFFINKPDPKGGGKTIEELVRVEIDLNGDGRVDVQRFYENGAKVRERFDLDYDGRFDLENFYNQGYIFKQAFYQRSKTSPDLMKYYEVIEEKGKKKMTRLARKERDLNLDGKMDYWEYWENGVLDRIGRDTDFDGKVDVWERAEGSSAAQSP